MNGLGAALKERSTTPVITRRERRENRERTRRRKKNRPQHTQTHTHRRTGDTTTTTTTTTKKGEGIICRPDSFFGFLFVSLIFFDTSRFCL